jgi:molybdopterin synthase catalytic subunit
MIKIVKEEIEIGKVLESVQDPSAGGIDIFIGTTRNHSSGKEVHSLEYQAYEPMALKLMNDIEEQIRRQWPVRKISLVHRIGKVAIGEASVVIAVSSVHRKEAFEACRYAIDTLKKTVPIWKKEIFADGEVWVGGQEER